MENVKKTPKVKENNEKKTLFGESVRKHMKVHDGNLELLGEIYANCGNFSEVARRAKMTPKGFHNFMAKHPKVREYLENVEEERNKKVDNFLYDTIKDESISMKYRIAAAREWNKKNPRYNSSRSQVEHSGEIKGGILAVPVLNEQGST